jgi:hypothetical protein
VVSVVDYYESFKYWNTYISGYSSRFKIHNGILDVKDGLVFYENEYYLPTPTSNVNKWNCKQSDLKDGRYNVTLLKQENDWYPRENSDRGNLILNLFIFFVKFKIIASLFKYITVIYHIFEYLKWNTINFYYIEIRETLD